MTPTKSILIAIILICYILKNIAHSTDMGPVCATDGISYATRGEYLCQKVCSNSSLEVAKYCQPMSCMPEYKPVCGNNGVTYRNRCMLVAAARLDYRILWAVNGRCPNWCIGNARNCWLPVCASDNVTYFNRRILSCLLNRKGLSPYVRSGECPCVIKPFWNPVCGSNGVTYKNLGAFYCTQRKYKALKILYGGKCDKVCTC